MLVLIMAFHVRIVLPSESRQLRVEPEQLQSSVAEVLYAHGILLNTRCGGQGVCDGCEVELIGGTVMDLDTRRPLNAGTAPMRLRACRSQFVPSGDVAVVSLIIVSRWLVCMTSCRNLITGKVGIRF